MKDDNVKSLCRIIKKLIIPVTAIVVLSYPAVVDLIKKLNYKV